ncbi:MAG: hypothetical protein H0X33_13195 [Taibaiella sp.]|nr:hypothetical protein [Taibaiella sp.]
MSLFRTNFDTQGQGALFTSKGQMEPAGLPGILQNPLGPASGEFPDFVTLYNIYLDGPLVNTNMVMPMVGDELTVTGLSAATLLYNGRWRVATEPEFYTGGTASSVIDNLLLRVVRITP